MIERPEVVSRSLSLKAAEHIEGHWFIPDLSKYAFQLLYGFTRLQGLFLFREVCVSLLEDMARRGLDTTREYLFVLDGSKALRSAVARVFGEKVHVQRCQQHKRRNVREHLPVEHQEAIDARIRSAYNMASYEDA